MSTLLEHSSENVIEASTPVLSEAQVSEFLSDLRSGRFRSVLARPQLVGISERPEYIEAFRAGFRRLLQSGNFSDAGFTMELYGRDIDTKEDLRSTFFGLLDAVDANQEFPLDQLNSFKIFFKDSDLESAPDYAERVSAVFVRLLATKKIDHALRFREMFGMNVPLSRSSALARDHFIQESETCIAEDKGKPRAEKKGPLHFLHIPLYRGMTYVFKIIEAAKKEDYGLAVELKKEYDALVAEDMGEISFSGMFDKRSSYHPRVIEGYAEVLETLDSYVAVPMEVEKSN